MLSPAKRALKIMAGAALGDYRFNRIYRNERVCATLSLPAGTMCSALENPSPDMADDSLLNRTFYAGEDAYGFRLLLEEQPAAICWFWGHVRFRDPLLWSLSAGEAIMVDLVTAPQFRGRGLATILIRYAAIEMRRLGMQNLYTWVWHSHHASYRAFERAGWRQIAWVLEVHPFGRQQPLRVRWPALPIPERK